MKVENAISRLKAHKEFLSKNGFYTKKAIDMAIEVLEKQDPKKPIEGYRFSEKMREAIRKTVDIHMADEKVPCCPSCGQPQRISEIIKKRDGVEIGNPFCWKCGQALKWSEQDE